MSTACIVVAAGGGTRLDAGVPKAFVDLCGSTLLAHALRRVRDSAAVDELVVVAPASHVSAVADRDVAVVVGGPTRQASVRRGLGALTPGVDVVLVHDAARALAPAALVAAVVAAVREGAPAVVPGVPVTDTLRALDGQPVDRSRLRAVQTPQGFARPVLERAHAAAAESEDDETLAATDDAGLVERLGEPVLLVPGAAEAFKITTPLDLLLATAVLERT